MKVVILAGGMGTRLSEYTKSIPKPMVKINNVPIIIHIMKHYAKYGFKDPVGDKRVILLLSGSMLLRYSSITMSSIRPLSKLIEPLRLFDESFTRWFEEITSFRGFELVFIIL